MGNLDNIRTGAPYNDPTFEALCRAHDIWGTEEAALCAAFWETAKRQQQTLSTHESLAQRLREHAASAEPSGYAYRYPDGIRFNDGRAVNGCKPTETLPYWFGAAPVAQQPVARVNDEGFIVETGIPLAPGTKLYTSAPVAAQAQPSGNAGELPTELDDLKLAYASACEERDHLRAALAAQSSAQDREDDESLADTQRMIIEAAERRGYARAEAENVGYRTDAGRYRFIRTGDAAVWCSSGDDLLTGDRLDAAIDTARAAARARPAMPALTDAMRAVLRNEHEAYESEDALYAALCDAAGAQPVVNQSLTTDLLERVSDALGRFVSDEGWTQADMDLSDAFNAALYYQPSAQDLEDAERYRCIVNEWFNDNDGGCDFQLVNIPPPEAYKSKCDIDAAIDAARGAKGADHA